MELLPLSTFNLAQYSGTWYRVLAIPRWYELGGANKIMMTYDPLTSQVAASLTVFHRLYQLQGSLVPTTDALSFDLVLNGSILFFRPRTSYRVKAVFTVNSQYKYVLIGDPTDRSLHILSRVATVPTAIESLYLQRAVERLGYKWNAVQAP